MGLGNKIVVVLLLITLCLVNLREKILLPSNSRKNVNFDLLIEQQNRIFWIDLIYLKRLAKGDAKAWKMLNDHEKCAIYKERNKTKLRFVKKFIWIAINNAAIL